MNNQLKLKLFDTLIRPILTFGSDIWITDYSVKDKTLEIYHLNLSILTYGSEIWITDYSVKDKTSDNLLFEKTS